MSLKKSILVIIAVLLIDQISKIYIKTNFALHEETPVFSWFRIVFVENKGQWGEKFKFQLKKNNVRIFFENDQILYQVINQEDIDLAHHIHHKKIKNERNCIYRIFRFSRIKIWFRNG